uniref:hypothetical protein n=1 Tax=Paraclostridium sordellii TaxID=1505 RepID=UPI00155DAFE1|nr:hypothetical protein [Paeniclostridium sordellii]
MEILNFILSQCISYLVDIFSGLSTNYISDKIKNHSGLPTKSGLELEIKFKFKISKK